MIIHPRTYNSVLLETEDHVIHQLFLVTEFQGGLKISIFEPMSGADAHLEASLDGRSPVKLAGKSIKIQWRAK